MKNIRIFLSENFRFLVVNVSVYLNRHVFVMITDNKGPDATVLKYNGLGSKLMPQR